MKLGKFTPQLCDKGAPVYCRGCEYKTRLHPMHRDIICDKDRIETYIKSLNENDRHLFNDMLNEKPLFPVELAIKYAFDSISEIRALGQAIRPLQIEQSTSSHADIGASQLNKKCAIAAYLEQKEVGLGIELIPKEEELKNKAIQGKLYHEISLKDPNYPCTYLSNFFLDDMNNWSRSTYCERNFKFKMNGIDISATPDCIVQIGKKIVVIDMKTGEAPPFFPYEGQQMQLTTYGIGAEYKTGLDAEYGMLVYPKKLGGGYSIRHFKIDNKSPEGIRNRQRTKEFALELYNKSNEFERDSKSMRDYVYSQIYKCMKQKKCYNYDFCWGSGLEKAIEKLSFLKH